MNCKFYIFLIKDQENYILCYKSGYSVVKVLCFLEKIEGHHHNKLSLRRENTSPVWLCLYGDDPVRSC